VFVVEVDDRHVIVDPELVDVVTFEGAPAKVLARRLHASECLRYQREARQRSMAALRRLDGGIRGKRPAVKREPGQ